MEAVVVTTIKDGILENQKVFIKSDVNQKVKEAEDYFIEQCEDNGTTLNKENRESALEEGYFTMYTGQYLEVYLRWVEVEAI